MEGCRGGKSFTTSIGGCAIQGDPGFSWGLSLTSIPLLRSSAVRGDEGWAWKPPRVESPFPSAILPGGDDFWACEDLVCRALCEGLRWWYLFPAVLRCILRGVMR